MRAYYRIILAAVLVVAVPSNAAHPAPAASRDLTAVGASGNQLAVTQTTLPAPLSDHAMAATIGAGWPSWLSGLADVARSVFDSFVDNLEDFLVVAAFLAGIGIGIAIIV